MRHYDELVFSPAVESETRHTADNPKRRLRNARKQTERSGIGTKSQQALQLQREEMKTERRQISREQRDAEAQRRFEMKQVKKKEKRRGHWCRKPQRENSNKKQWQVSLCLPYCFSC